MSSLSKKLQYFLSISNQKKKYVKNGLLIQLDGIQGQSEASTWEDLSGNNNNFNLSHVSNEENGKRFSGLTAPYSYAQCINNFDVTNCYLELYLKCEKTGTSQFIFGSNNNSNIVTVRDSGEIGTKHSYNAQNSMIFGEKIHLYIPFTSVSLFKDNSRIIRLNLNDLIFSNNTVSWVSAGLSGLRLGYYTSTINKSYQFNGIIYALRLYNRPLSETELINNYNLDKERYG